MRVAELSDAALATAADLANRLLENLHHQLAKLPAHATRNDWYMALAYTARDRMLDCFIKTLEAITGANTVGLAIL